MYSKWVKLVGTRCAKRLTIKIYMCTMCTICFEFVLCKIQVGLSSLQWDIVRYRFAGYGECVIIDFFAAARVRAQVSPVGFVVGKVALGQNFLRVLRFSPVNIIPPWAPLFRKIK
jgi:hypothetical protein